MKRQFYCESFNLSVALTWFAQKRRRLRLSWKLWQNEVYSTTMKVISNTILFLYSLRSALIEIARECHTRWRNYFDGATPLLERSRI